MSKETSEIIPQSRSIVYVDVGNSSIKAAVHDGDWSTVERFAHSETTAFLNWLSAKAEFVESMVLSSVVEKTTRQIIEHDLSIDLITVETDDLSPELLDYSTPQTLGIDRYLACYGAVALQHSSVVVIDAGTACTIDYMSADNVFYGGVIMPGISAMEQAVKLHAPALPEVARTIPEVWPGKSTQDSLQWGLAGAFADSLKAALARYREAFGPFDLVLTGGDAQWLSMVIKTNLRIEPLLVFKGMKCFIESEETK